MNFRFRFIAVAALLMALQITHARPAFAQDKPAACNDTPGFHLLDFWVGRWDVYVGKDRVGTDIVEKPLNGCAVTETWDGGPGDHGFSLFYFNIFTKKWSQVWVTDSATQNGGLKEKYFVGAPSPGATRFQGALPAPHQGLPVLDRTTLTPAAAHKVRQVIEISVDGGTTWKTTFDAMYVPMGSAP